MNNYPFHALKHLPLQFGDLFGSTVWSWRVLPSTAILVLLGWVIAAQNVHAQGAICTLCELRPGNCAAETLAACQKNKGTGETGGSSLPRDSNTKAPGSEPTKSGATKNTNPSPTLPDIESLTGKPKANDGWGGGRSTDTRPKEQHYQPQAKQTAESLQNLTGGGRTPPEGWNGGLKSNSRTIEPSRN